MHATATRRLTPAEVAGGEFRCHPVTVRNALAGGELHGSQRVKGGRWTVEEACAEAWVSGRPCEHQVADVVELKSVAAVRKT